MKASVVLCTWNRCEQLAKTLEAMCALRVPPGSEWELLVVNNNCTDATDGVIASFEDRLLVRRLFEPKQGLSSSRNCGIAAAAGELIVFTDDDVFVEPGWLAAYFGAADRWPEAAYFGGRIVPQFENRPPGWLQTHLRPFGNMLGVRDFGSEERPFRGEEQPFGGNMAFRAGVFQGRRFNPDLGRSEQARIMGEEGVLFSELSHMGAGGVWVPGAELKHFIPKSCFSRKFLWHYFRGKGQTIVRVHGPKPGKLLWGIPRHQIREYCLWRLKSWALYPVRREAAMLAFVTAAKVRGEMEESRAIHGRNGSAPEPVRPGCT